MNFDDLYRLLRGARVQPQDIVDTVREPLLVLDEKLCVVVANRSFFEVFHAGRDEIIGRHFYELAQTHGPAWRWAVGYPRVAPATRRA